MLQKVPAGKGYKIEILDIQELKAVTVADSLAILITEFKSDRDVKIEHMRGVLQMTNLLPDNAERKALIARQNATIDSLAGLSVPAFYEGLATDKVLAKVVRCRYAVTTEGAPSSIEETFDFWLSPDGSNVEHQRRAR